MKIVEIVMLHKFISVWSKFDFSFFPLRIIKVWLENRYWLLYGYCLVCAA